MEVGKDEIIAIDAEDGQVSVPLCAAPAKDGVLEVFATVDWPRRCPVISQLLCLRFEEGDIFVGMRLPALLGVPSPDLVQAADGGLGVDRVQALCSARHARRVSSRL